MSFFFPDIEEYNYITIAFLYSFIYICFYKLFYVHFFIIHMKYANIESSLKLIYLKRKFLQIKFKDIRFSRYLIKNNFNPLFLISFNICKFLEIKDLLLSTNTWFFYKIQIYLSVLLNNSLFSYLVYRRNWKKNYFSMKQNFVLIL